VNDWVGQVAVPAAFVAQLIATEPEDVPVAVTTGMLIRTDEFGLPTGTPAVAVEVVKPVDVTAKLIHGDVPAPNVQATAPI